MSTARWPGRASDWGAILLGALTALLGLAMLIGGVDLISLGGSWYYAICGAVVAAAGLLIALGRRLGISLYLAAWVGTLIWSLWEVGLDGWGLLPRLFGPSLLAVPILLTIPVLRRHERAARSIRRSRGAA